MKKILVTTDFSENAKAALCFAITMAVHHTYELTLFYVYPFLKPTTWSEHTSRLYEKKEHEKIKRKLRRFVESVNKKLTITPVKIKIDAVNSSLVCESILKYAADHEYDIICTSTKGEGRFKRILGSITSQLIQKSRIKLIAVPAGYQAKKLHSVLCASDFSDLGIEIKLVTEFARSVNAELGILHIQGQQDFNIDPELMNQMIKKIAGYPITLYLRNGDPVKTLSANIQSAIEEISPSLLVMFTDQHKNIFEKILFPSFTGGYIFKSGIPVLIYKK